jgi:adenosyl cobinamide kinase/adenosyl cobinamide phosphate guanylyltransferase
MIKDSMILENKDVFEIRFLVSETDEDGDTEDIVKSHYFRRSAGWTRAQIEEALDKLSDVSNTV